MIAVCARVCVRVEWSPNGRTLAIEHVRSLLVDCAALRLHARVRMCCAQLLLERIHVQGSPTQVTQSCMWQFLLFKGQFNMVVNVTEGAAKRGVAFDLVRSKFMRDFKGRWELESINSSHDSCRVVYTMEVAPALSPPPAFSGYTSKIFVRQARVVIDDLVNELKRRRDALDALADPP